MLTLTVMVIAILIIVGLALGSFANALVYRLHAQAELDEEASKAKKSSGKTKADKAKLSVAKGRSMCLHCGHELAAKDLVPVLSWLSLRGKCRYCTAKIPDTPVAELLTPALFVASYVWWPLTLGTSIAWLVFLGWLAAVVCFVALTIYDFRWFILPDKIVFWLVGISAVLVGLKAYDSGNSWLDVFTGAFWGVIIIAGLFYVLFTASKGKWIGGGDVKLGIALGLLAGGAFEALLVILIASFAGLVFMLPSMAKGKTKGNTKLPFGPFLLLGAFVTVLFGTGMIQWYLGLTV